MKSAREPPNPTQKENIIIRAVKQATKIAVPVLTIIKLIKELTKS